MPGIMKEITQLARCGAQFRSEQLEELGLKGCHASYLLEICAEPGLSQDALAQRICINKSNVARQMTVLEEGGFVTRQVCAADKRMMALYPTQKTLDLLPRIHAILRSWSDCITCDLSPGEQALVEACLKKMMRRASAWMDEK